jgi:hypothetical protein
MMCTPCMFREVKVVRQMMIFTPCMSNYYLYDFFVEIIDNYKIRGK